MANADKRWRRIQEDGAEWETRVTAGPAAADPGRPDDDEVLEFVCLDGTRRVRRIAVPAGATREMDEEALRRAYRRALPIGGDHYGRPGKRMADGV